MPDFTFTRFPHFETWVINAPHRAKRPHDKKNACPFCPGNPHNKEEVYRIGGYDHDNKWLVKVIPNKYPFAPIHEVVIHSPEHDKDMAQMSVEQLRFVLETYQNRFQTHLAKGTVCIFANNGKQAGESIHHSHSQIAVVPKDVPIIVPRLEENLVYKGEIFGVGAFDLICPPYSQWPDEVWIVPKERGRLFSEISFQEIESMAYILKHLVRILKIRHGDDFPFNYYIYPFRDWYLRLLPRAKTLGGFEMATGIFVNTQDPKESMQFIKNFLFEEDEEKIKEYRAEYRKGV